MATTLTLAGQSAAVQATARYPRLVYDGKTIDIAHPLTAVLYEDVPVAGANVSTSGVREVLAERVDKYCTMQVLCRPVIARAIQRMIRDWTATGKRVELYVDRFLRAWWGFDEDAATDSNGGNAFTASAGGTLTYAALTEGKGINVPTSGRLSASLVSTLAGGAGNVFLLAAEGTLALQFKPSWAGNDGAEHVLLDCLTPGTPSKNRLTLKKRASNVLHFTLAGANGAEVGVELAVTFGASTEQTMLAEWDGATVKMRLGAAAVVSTLRFPIVAAASRIAGTGLLSGQTSPTANGIEQSMDAAPSIVVLGSDYDAALGRATGVCGMLAVYQAAYGLPDSLGTYQHPWRTYYPTAELDLAAYAPGRLMPSREISAYQLRFREVA